MRRSKYRRATSPSWLSGKRRLAAVAATLVAFGGVVTVTQISDAGTERSTDRALAACDRLRAPQQSDLSTETREGTYTTNRGRVTQHSDDGASDVATTAEVRERCRQWVMQNAANRGNGGRGNGGNQGGGNGGNQGGGQADPSAPAEEPPAEGGEQPPAEGGEQPPAEGGEQPPAEGGDNGGDQGGDNGGDQGGDNGGDNGGDQGGDNGGEQGTPPPGAGLGILANSCEGTNLAAHDGFQNGDRCVSTAFGEVGTEGNNPTLLITQAPRQVQPNTPFTLQISTRNLIRDRFLAAGQGGYYVESSVLQDGIVRGHFHTACRMLGNTNEAPDPAPVPAFFVATEDSQGGRTPDTVAIQVPGLPEAGTAQCSAWAGDGSHRIPMMQRANQTPAFDSVRVQVGNRNNGGRR